MGNSIHAIVRLILAGKQVYARKWSFLGLFVFAFFSSVVVLWKLDLLPESSASAAAAPVISLSTRVSRPELPTNIDIAVIGLSATVVNPATTGTESLDAELLKGAVRYPTSARLGEAGNVVLFGHSSYLPIVRNRAYKSFNGIQKLAVGDSITVYSTTAVYIYRVRTVVKESANNNTAIPLEISGRVLTLVTCNSFGAKEDRFVVTADFVESRAISG